MRYARTFQRSFMFDDDERPGGWGQDPSDPEAQRIDGMTEQVFEIMDKLFEIVDEQDLTDDEEQEDPNAPQPSYLNCRQCRKPIRVGEPYLFQLLYPLIQFGCGDAFLVVHFRCISEFSRHTSDSTN